MPKLTTKVHPNAAAAAAGDTQVTVTTTCGGACTTTGIAAAPAEPNEAEPPATVLTVWRRSLLFNCDGFTVYDAATGDLAFRVDSYAASGRRRAEVLLMDAAGAPLLTVRRRKRWLGFFMADHWVIYDGDAAADAELGTTSTSKPLLSVRRRRHRRSSSSSKAAKAAVKPLVAYVTPMVASSSSSSPSYVVEGSYGRRACAVRERDAGVVAEVRRKEAVVGLGDDVFRLVVDPRLGATMAMGLVIALDEMFAAGGRSSSSAALLRSIRTWSV